MSGEVLVCTFVCARTGSVIAALGVIIRSRSHPPINGLRTNNASPPDIRTIRTRLREPFIHAIRNLSPGIPEICQHRV
ncbi:hypothetical protein BDZ89DRAFT_1062555 [Hymenopellis radicata]|nr:hypothetical protein BDZ89DRAFT_1062555 [Hymenopellis radicata]